MAVSAGAGKAVRALRTVIRKFKGGAAKKSWQTTASHQAGREFFRTQGAKATARSKIRAGVMKAAPVQRLTAKPSSVFRKPKARFPGH